MVSSLSRSEGEKREEGKEKDIDGEKEGEGRTRERTGSLTRSTYRMQEQLLQQDCSHTVSQSLWGGGYRVWFS